MPRGSCIFRESVYQEREIIGRGLNSPRRANARKSERVRSKDVTGPDRGSAGKRLRTLRQPIGTVQDQRNEHKSKNMRKATSAFLAFAIYITFIGAAAIPANAQVTNGVEQRLKDVPDGLTFRLSQGVEGANSRQKSAPAATDPIPDGQANDILKRLPAIKSDPSDQTAFAKRIGSLPAPKAGNRIPVKFPSDEMRNPPRTNGGADTLDVLRFSPEGEVSLAPDLSVTFSQPMVAVSSQQQAAEYAPVEISPQVEGRWRWLGTKTLMFDTDKRFPMATKFKVRIPKGTRSATGQTLRKDVTWTFTTPPPKVETFLPGDGAVTRRDALMYLQFDQQIDPQAVLKTIAVTSNGTRSPLRLATPEEIGSDYTIAYRSKEAQPGRWLAFRAVNPAGATQDALPGASRINVTVQKGTPSAEGPLTTTEPANFSFQTYGPLKFVKGYCGWPENKTCSPFETWVLEFNNSLEASNFAQEIVSIEPAVQGLKIYPTGNCVYITGYRKGNTTYKITVDGSIRDIYGQVLGRATSVSIRVGQAPTNLHAQGGFMTLLDPTAKPSFSIYSTNLRDVRVRLYDVEPSDWGQYQDYLRHLNYDDGKRPNIPGRLISDKVLPIAAKDDEMVETRIDPSAGLTGGFGNVIIVIDPTVRRDQYDRTEVISWLQATQIGLDAFVDNSDLVGFATELQSGKPLSGVDLSIYPTNGTPVAGETATSDQPGILHRMWDWLAAAKGNGPNAGTEAVDPDGTTPSVETIEPTQAVRTGENGILRLALPTGSTKGGPSILVARKGADMAFLPENAEYYWNDSGSWYKKPDVDQLRWYTFDDRKVYKPKEQVSVKGYIRNVTGGKFGDVQGLATTLRYEWKAKDPRGNEIAKGEISTNPFGAFDLKFNIPDNANLGQARVEFMAPGDEGVVYAHGFQVQEFRRPEFEVSAKVESDGPFFVGASATVGVDAHYYAGGGLANAETSWTVTATPTNYTPPNRGDYTFGTWVPWWRAYDYGEFSGRGFYGGGTTQTFKGVTDAAGKHVLKIDFDSVKPPRPYAITASAAVQDVNRQTWSSSASLLVHPSDLYVGIRTQRTFVQKGEKIDVESIVSDIDGRLVPDRQVEIKAVLKDWAFEKGIWVEKVVDEQSCSIKSADKGVTCSFIAKQGGQYSVKATVVDERDRPNESSLTVWVPGGKVPPTRSVEKQEVQIIPSKKDYQPGDVAELLVISPFTPAEGVLTLRREGLVKTERFTMKDSSTTLRVPLDPRYLPNITAQVDLVGSVARTNDRGEPEPKLAPRPAFASGNIGLSISTASRKLAVSAEPLDKSVTPGAQTKVAVEVKDNEGRPVAASEVAVVVVDESVLALSRYTIGDPMDTFYTGRGPGVSDYHLRQEVLLANPGDVKVVPPPTQTNISVDQAESLPKGRAFDSLLKAAPSARMSGSSAAENSFTIEGQEVGNFRNGTLGSDGGPIALRQNFDALAVWSPTVRTDANGRATVDVTMPDNLTRYRITAVSVDTDKRFGKAESSITAKQPLMVRPSAPRFLNFGDKADLPVVVQNQTDNDMAVDVALRATNARVFGNELASGDSVSGVGKQVAKRVLVKANDRVEVRFPVMTETAGTARFQFAVTSGKFNDAAEISLPVWTPATTEAFATYGTTDQDGAIVQPVRAPADVFPQFGGVEISTSSTQLQELTDAFLYLTNYPYACSEQISSRMISIAAMRDVLGAFKAKDMPTLEDLNKYFARDIEILKSRQRDDGSFGLWKRDRERYEYPFLTVHVAHALTLAKAKGYKVPAEMLNKTRPYLRDIEKHYDEWYTNAPEVRWTISAYALYVRDLMGDKDTAKAKKLLTEATIEKMPFEALGWVLSVLANDPGSQTEVQAIIRHLMNRTTETAGTANFVTNYGDAAWLIMYSNRRADGVLLEALIKADPKNDLIPKLVRGLLDHRVKGAWSNTQENVFIVLALDRYFNAFEKVTPDMVTRIWLGNTYAGEDAFKGRSVDTKELMIPMSYLSSQGGTSDLIIDRRGAGRLYYRIGMKYAPKNLKLDPADYGFTVLRSYEAVDDKDDVKQNADGSWAIKAGARVRVRLTMVAQSRRYHVALVDPLPAGLEILNPELAVTEAVPDDKQPSPPVVLYGSRSYGYGTRWLQRYWFEHQNFRDERAEAFASLLWEGVYTYSYVARATTPGDFVVPPTKAEEMYHPETFGRTGTDLVHVE